MLLHTKIVCVGITLLLSMLTLLIGGASHSLAAPTSDAVVQPPCGEAEFDAALMTVQASASGGTITFHCANPTTITFTSIKLIDGNVVIDGGAPDAITLSGGNTTGLFLVDIGNLTMRNLTLANASATQQGAITVGLAGKLTLDNCALKNNHAVGHSGGAIDDSGAMTVTNSLFSNNQADVNGGAIHIDANAWTLISGTTFLSNSTTNSGGALYNLSDIFVVNSYFANNTAAINDGGGIWTGNHLDIDNSTFYSNTAASGWGGGLYNQGTLIVTNGSLNANTAKQGGGGVQTYLGQTQLYNLTILNNKVALGTGIGGGLSNSQGQLTAENSTISGNRAAGGGGISNHSGSASLIGLTLSNNAAAVTGGGIKNENGSVSLTNATLSGNTALGGGGFYNYTGTAYLTNVSLSGNSASNIGGGVSNSSFGTPHLGLFNVIVADNPIGGNCYFGKAPDYSESNLSSDNTCSFGAGRDNVDAMLAPLGNYGGPTQTYLPLPGSPAIDHGNNTDCLNIDQRGKSRPVNGTCDVGAVERQLVDVSYFIWLPLIEK
ncbi:MAG: choice-of-anchor Q domain-containing protein [Anaerolineae bacterium]